MARETIFDIPMGDRWQPQGDLGSMDSRWTKNGKLVPWVIHQLLGFSDTLETLHGMNMRHGDLKSENILQFKDDKGFGTLIITDIIN